MSYRNNQRFNRSNQYQPNQSRNFQVTTAQNFNQQQLGTIRFTGNSNLPATIPTARIQGSITQPQNVFSQLQGVQASAAAGLQPWGTGVAVQGGQALQPQGLPPGFQNALQAMANPQQNAANMMGLLANQQLLAQAAGLMANPGLGMQVPFTGPGILGAAPMRGQLPQMFSSIGQTGLGKNGQSDVNQRNSRSSNQNQGHKSTDRGSSKDQRSRSDSKDRHGQNRDRGNKWGDTNEGRHDDRRGDRREDRKDDRRDDRRDDRKTDRIKDTKDIRKTDQRDDRITNRREDRVWTSRQNVQPADSRDRWRDDRNDRDQAGDRRDIRKDDRPMDRRDDRKKDNSDDRRRQHDDRRDPVARRDIRGDNIDTRNRGDGDRDRDRNRPYRDGSRSDRTSSPDRKKFKGQDSSKASSSSSQKSRHKDQDSDTEDNTFEAAEEEEIPAWLRCSPSDLYFNRDNAMFKDTALVYACVGGRDLHIGLECDEFHLVPGAIVSQLTVEALQRASQIPGHKTIYFIAGIPDLLTTLTSPGYEETIFEDRNLFDSFYGQMRQTDMVLKQQNCHVVFSTISSMSLKGYNENNKKVGKTYTLRFEKKYPEMQENLHKLLKQINDSIISINTEQKLLTPLIHCHINKMSREKKKINYRLNKLLDGLNPCGTIVDGWRDIMNRTILRNRVLMNRPDFLMTM